MLGKKRSNRSFERLDLILLYSASLVQVQAGRRQKTMVNEIFLTDEPEEGGSPAAPAEGGDEAAPAAPAEGGGEGM